MAPTYSGGITTVTVANPVLTPNLFRVLTDYTLGFITTGPGTVSNSANSSAVVGIGTDFLSRFSTGDAITIPLIAGQQVTVSSVIDNTHITVTPNITNANTSVGYCMEEYEDWDDIKIVNTTPNARDADARPMIGPIGWPQINSTSPAPPSGLSIR